MLDRITVVLICLLMSMGLHAEDPAKPNIVFILADDLGINDLGCYGRSEHKTPHLDRLAQEGVRCTSAYSAQSVCSPTRAAILTGLTPARLKMTTFLPGRADAVSQMLLHPKLAMNVPSDVKTLPQLLKQAGYTTACIGKWHLGGNPTQQGFDTFHAGKANTAPSSQEGGKGEFDLTLQAEQFLEKSKQQPFFLYLCHNNPHIPLAAPAELVEKYRDTFNPLYAAMMETLDASIGRILAKLQALGLSENTIVIFTSDNGGLHVLEGGQTPTYNTPYRAGKGFLYEGGVRVPLLVRWPGKIQAGTVMNDPVISTDWTPTLLTAAGISSSQTFDGSSILGLLTQKQPLPPRPLCWHQPHYMNQGSRPSGAIRLGPWKLIEHYELGNCELYNLESDIGERKDLSDKEPARVAEMRGKLEAWRRSVGAATNLPNPDFRHELWRKLYFETDVSMLSLASKGQLTTAKLASWRSSMNAVMSNKKLEPGLGAIVLAARDAIVHGEKLRHEPEPHKDTIGYWANMNDWVEWKFHVSRNGLFEVILLQAAGKGSGGAQIDVKVNGQSLQHIVQETGHFQRFVPVSIGSLQLKEGAAQLAITARTKPGFGVMDLRRVILRSMQ